MADNPRRGRPPRAEPAESTGFRVTAAVRQELTLAQGFLGERSLQGVLDRAVRHYLDHLGATVDGFADAVAAAQAHVAPKRSTVTDLRRPGRR